MLTTSFLLLSFFQPADDDQSYEGNNRESYQQWIQINAPNYARQDTDEKYDPRRFIANHNASFRVVMNRSMWCLTDYEKTLFLSILLL